MSPRLVHEVVRFFQVPAFSGERPPNEDDLERFYVASKASVVTST